MPVLYVNFKYIGCSQPVIHVHIFINYAVYLIDHTITTIALYQHFKTEIHAITTGINFTPTYYIRIVIT